MPEIIEDLVKETSAKAMSDRNERPAIQPKISFYQGKPSEDKEKEEIDKIIKLEKYLSYKIVYEIIPEIDMPGHTASLIASYPELGTVKEKINVKK